MRYIDPAEVVAIDRKDLGERAVFIRSGVREVLRMAPDFFLGDRDVLPDQRVKVDGAKEFQFKPEVGAGLNLEVGLREDDGALRVFAFDARQEGPLQDKGVMVPVGNGVDDPRRQLPVQGSVHEGPQDVVFGHRAPGCVGSTDVRQSDVSAATTPQQKAEVSA